MNAPFPQPSKAERQSQLDYAHWWRGACIQEFGQLELLVGSALQLLAASRPTARVKIGQQFRPAIEELKRVTGAKAAFAKVGKALHLSINGLEPMLDWRAHLTHGVLDVWRGRERWLITLQYRECDNSGPIRWHAMPFEDAASWKDELVSEVKKLAQRLDALQRLPEFSP